MGVINMAHGELMMIGAYTTYVIQNLFRAHWPGAFDAYVLVAIPAAFLVAAAVGGMLERGVIRFLYGRPLETLLATWGISLILQQAVRTTFGPTNREVGAPNFMSGAFELVCDASVLFHFGDDRLELGERLLGVPNGAMILDERRVGEPRADLLVLPSDFFELFEHGQSLLLGCRFSSRPGRADSGRTARGRRREVRAGGAAPSRI